MLSQFPNKYSRIHVNQSKYLPGAISGSAEFVRYDRNPEFACSEFYDVIDFFPGEKYSVDRELDLIVSEKGAVFAGFDLSHEDYKGKRETIMRIKGVMEKSYPEYDFDIVIENVALDIANYDEPGESVSVLGNTTHLLLVRNYEEIARRNKLAGRVSEGKSRKKFLKSI